MATITEPIGGEKKFKRKWEKNNKQWERKLFFNGEWKEKGKYKNENRQIGSSHFFALENKKCNISFRENANQNLKMLPNIIYLLLDVYYYFIEICKIHFK